MFSSFFEKTKPINYFVLSGFLVLVYAIRLFLSIQGDWTQAFFPLEILGFAAVLLSIFVINEIVRAEKVTSFNSFAMLFFVLLLVAFSETLSDKNAVFANMFLLVGVWRLLAIKSMRNVKHKVFDATFLIGLASLFYDWALIYLILVFLVINLYDGKTFKNWLVPWLALATLFILTFAVLKLNGSLSFFAQHYQFSLDVLFKEPLAHSFRSKLIIYLLLMLVLIVFVFTRTRKKGGGKLVSLRIIFMAFLLGTLLDLLKTNEASSILVTFFPAAIFWANFLESVKRKKLREAILTLCAVVPFLLLVIELNH
ncbi:hypothetical protein GTQ34_06855 [Muricauda sp. JGD-17]|uniref:Uncharacterized protein n=1 Tax=Flagellimonas ochracea TaxID=2696472 RepID=A0A964WX06_9FLAO|nr:DUF6427 family protein [Allomuricauda ochracea]NAY91631.1 hypothetical protein [Allomuricauda ochracea]